MFYHGFESLNPTGMNSAILPEVCVPLGLMVYFLTIFKPNSSTATYSSVVPSLKFTQDTLQEEGQFLFEMAGPAQMYSSESCPSRTSHWQKSVADVPERQLTVATSTTVGPSP